MKQFDMPDGTEITLRRVKGRLSHGLNSGDAKHHSAVTDSSGTTIKGRYMAVTLNRLFLNIPLKSSYTNKVSTFTIVGATFENLWDYRLSIDPGKFKMIDSENFQYSGDIYKRSEYSQVVIPSTKQVEDVEFAWPELTLESRAKDRGWIWFKPLPAGVIPHRLIFRFNIFEPGNTSGWVKDQETIEFILTNCEQGALKQLPS